MKPTREQLVVLGLLAAPNERTGHWPLDALRRSGLEVKDIIEKLGRSGLVEFRNGLSATEYGYQLTEQGRLTLRLTVSGQDCAWCGHAAVDGKRIKGAATWIYFCESHREIGEESAEGERSDKGSLYGQIRAGKVQPREPDEVRA